MRSTLGSGNLPSTFKVKENSVVISNVTCLQVSLKVQAHADNSKYKELGGPFTNKTCNS